MSNPMSSPPPLLCCGRLIICLWRAGGISNQMEGLAVGHQQWPCPNVDLWCELLELLNNSTSVYEWIKVPGHGDLEGNEHADALAELGRKSSFLYSKAGCWPLVLFTPVAASLRRTILQSLLVYTGSIIQGSAEMMQVVCDAELCFTQVTPLAGRGGAFLPIQEVGF